MVPATAILIWMQRASQHYGHEYPRCSLRMHGGPCHDPYAMAARRTVEGGQLRRGDVRWRPTHLVGTGLWQNAGDRRVWRIGQEMARRAHHGFGMDIGVHKRSKYLLTFWRAMGLYRWRHEDLMPLCDFVSLLSWRR